MRKDRLDLYRQLEEQRDSKLIVYVTGTRLGLETQIANDVLPKFAEHLDKIGDTEKISLYLYTNGGDTLAAWSLVNLIRSFCNKLEIIIPSNCFSCSISSRQRSHGIPITPVRVKNSLYVSPTRFADNDTSTSADDTSELSIFLKKSIR